MILVCGAPDDQGVALVRSQLVKRGMPHRYIDLNDFPVGYQCDWTWSPSGINGTIQSDTWTLDLEDLTGVYTRYIVANPSQLAAVEDFKTTARLEAQAGLSVLLEQLPVVMTSRVGPGMASHSKPYQVTAIRRAGLSIPDSMVTSDPHAARAFCASQGDVVVKSLCSAPGPVHRVADADLARLEANPKVPLYLQRFIRGDNIRVHSVGDELFATRCVTSAVDYRYAAPHRGQVQFEAIELPAWVESACRKLAVASDQILTGIDLKCTPEEEYYCFELNPAPVFAWYERQTGQPISVALVQLLHDGVASRRGNPYGAATR